MKNTARLCFLIYILFNSAAQARLFLDVSIVNKKGIDIGLILGSEIHAREEVRPSEDIKIAMKSGLSILLRASFDEGVESGVKERPKNEKNLFMIEKDRTFKNVISVMNKLKEGVKYGINRLLVIGPSSKVVIRGRVFGTDGEVVEDFFDEPLIVALGESAVMTHSKDAQLVEIKIKPHID